MKNNRKTLKPFLIILLALIVLTPGFYRNEWLATGKIWFYDWRKLQEAMVIARIVESRGTGTFSYGGLLGFGCTTKPVCSWDTFDLEQEYLAYKDNGRFQSYSPYTSHSGLQGVVFSLIEQITDFSPSLNLKLFHGAVSLASAFVLGLFIYWVFKELGTMAGSLTLLFIMFSEWLTLFSGNIFWNIWAFYLPFIASSFYLMQSSKKENYNQLTISALLALAMLVKCLFTGFEYITTALVMPVMPLVYYAIRDSWKCTNFFKRAMYESISLLAGMIAGLLILIWQITQVKTGFQEAVTTIFNTLGKRSIGDPTQYAAEAESLKASLFPVLAQYINGRAILIRRVLPINNSSIDIEISYLALFTLFLCFTMLLLLLMRANMLPVTRMSSYAIIVTTWVSALAPLSWFIIFKAHSFVHTQMNFIVWQMPFTLYGFALCGYTIELIGNRA